MKNFVKIFSIVIPIFFILGWLQSCDNGNMSFTNGNSQELVSTNDFDQSQMNLENIDPVEPVDSINSTESIDSVEPIETVDPVEKNLDTQFLTPEQKQEEFKRILENPSLQDGKKVKVCISYVGSGHSCNRGEFNVFFNDETLSSSLNLNNSGLRADVDLISGAKLDVGSTVISKIKDEDLVSYSDDLKNLIKLHRPKNHVPGTAYTTIWKDGKLKVTVQCAKNSCHTGIAAISMIGEVTISDGSKKYLSSELATLPTSNSAIKEYEFSTFKLVDEMSEFDDYCGFKTIK